MRNRSKRLLAWARAGVACLGLGMVLVSLGAGDAQAQDTRTLAKFLSSCNLDAKDCRYNLHDYTMAAKDQNMICMPKDISINEAVDKELDWLRNVGAQKEDIYSGNAEDAEWTAMSTLWPCSQGS
jgi:hypothetical protein